MKRIVVNGGRSLCGNVEVSGSKNAALPIIFACILTNGVSEIENLPDIGDVRVAFDIISGLGATVETIGKTTYIDTRKMSYTVPDLSLVGKIRASSYLLGSCLSRFGRCHILPFGGCNFSLRPIDMHIDACLAMGAEQVDNCMLAKTLKGTDISFSKASVGATVNSILLAASATGETIVRGCAVEPHIDALVDFINSCGGSVSRRDRELHIIGRELHGGKIRIIGDMIEAGTYLALGGMLGGKINVLSSPDEEMCTVYDSLSKIVGTNKEFSGNISVIAEPYPGFPTDLQPIFAPLMACFCGGEIIDSVWPTRFGYLDCLSSFGINYNLDKNRATIYTSQIHNACVSAPDLRGGMACLMSALYAKGQSEIYSADTILRGYEGLEKKLCALGADITIEDIKERKIYL